MCEMENCIFFCDKWLCFAYLFLSVCLSKSIIGEFNCTQH